MKIVKNRKLKMRNRLPNINNKKVQLKIMKIATRKLKNINNILYNNYFDTILANLFIVNYKYL